GIDDAMAIFYALESGQFDLVGLTTIFGNCLTTQSTQNALRLLEIAGRTDIPVAKGANHCLTRTFDDPAAFVHGEDGQGDVGTTPPTTTAIDETAAQFIVNQIMSQPGEITLVPVGPLTNIALALRLEPRIVDNVKEVVLMGGAVFCQGNVNAAAEANIFNDAEAADVVFGAGWPVTMVGLDVTQQVYMSTEQLDAYNQSDKVTSQHIGRILPKYLEFHEEYYPGIDGIYVHDSTAITYLLDPSIFDVKQAPVVVETQGISRGATWAGTAHQLSEPWAGRPPVTICVDVDASKAVEMEMATV
ncbi:MAG: nucleoside hydrolase, partial [Chloroflexota bacterium]